MKSSGEELKHSNTETETQTQRKECKKKEDKSIVRLFLASMYNT